MLPDYKHIITVVLPVLLSIEMKKLLIALPFVVLAMECITYALNLNAHAFWGIAKVEPKFRDFYILPINALCNIKIPDFYTLGSCSDQFYGIPAGSFDYPALIFYIARIVPDIIFQNPIILAMSNGILFLICMLIYCFANQKYINTHTLLSIYLLLFSHPVRYALERGQLDLLTWSLMILSCVFLNASSAHRKIKYRISNIKSSSPQLLQNFALFFMAASAATKAFTLGSYSIFWLLFAKKSSRIYKLLTLALYIVVLVLILYPVGLPGKNASLIQSTPGEIFGFSVGLSGELPKTALKILVCIFGFLVTISTLNYSHSSLIKNNCNQIIASIIFEPLAVSGASSYCMFYFLSSSANYKLVSAGLFLVGISLLSSRLTTRKSELNNQSHYNRILIFRNIATLTSISILYHNYRPYIEELEFISQGQFDFFWCPLMAGICLAYLYLILLLLIEWRPRDYVLKNSKTFDIMRS